MLGEKIKSLRKKKKLTQEELAAEIGVSRQAIAKWETEGGMPDIENLKALSDYFDVSIDELVKESDKLKTKDPLQEKFRYAEGFAFFLGLTLWFFSKDTYFGFTITFLLPSAVWAVEKFVLNKYYQKTQQTKQQKENLQEVMPTNWYGKKVSTSPTKLAKKERLKNYASNAFGLTAIWLLFDVVTATFGTFPAESPVFQNPFLNFFFEFAFSFIVIFCINVCLGEWVIKKYNNIE